MGTWDSSENEETRVGRRRARSVAPGRRAVPSSPAWRSGPAEAPGGAELALGGHWWVLLLSVNAEPGVRCGGRRSEVTPGGKRSPDGSQKQTGRKDVGWTAAESGKGQRSRSEGRSQHRECERREMQTPTLHLG